MMLSKNINIQGKTHYRLNEVCSITGVKPYVLRFWENEFSEIKPNLSAQGEKLYSQKDLDVISLIKKLLFRDKLTIEKAKYELKLHPFMQEKPMSDEAQIAGQLPEVPLPETSMIREESTPYHDLVKEKLKTIILKSETIEKNHHWFQV